MTRMVLTKKTFIGHGPAGRLGLPGETVDVDEKGVPLIAGSTPVGNMTDDQLEAELKRRKKASGDTAKREPNFGDNVAPPKEADAGEQRLEIAPFRPAARGVNPQAIPPGTEEHQGRFVRPAPEDSPAAIEVVVGEGAEEGVVDESSFDHDGDGKAGGSPKGGNRKKK